MSPNIVYCTDDIVKYLNDNTSLGTDTQEVIKALGSLKRDKLVFKQRIIGKKSYWIIRDIFNECRNFHYTNHNKQSIGNFELGKCNKIGLCIYSLSYCKSEYCLSFRLRRKVTAIQKTTKEKGSFIGRAEGTG